MNALDLRVQRELKPVTNSQLAICPTWAKAMALSVDLSGMRDKALAIEIDMDPAQFSKTVSGQLGVMPDRMFRFMDACGTELPLMWLLYQRGYDVEALRQRETELQRRVRELEDQLAQERRERQVITNFVREARAA